MPLDRPDIGVESVQRIEPARVENPPAPVADLVADLSAASAKLGRSLHTRTAANLADVVRSRSCERAVASRFVIQPSVELVRDLRWDSESSVAVATLERVIRQNRFFRHVDDDARRAAMDALQRHIG